MFSLKTIAAIWRINLSIICFVAASYDPQKKLGHIVITKHGAMNYPLQKISRVVITVCLFQF